MPATNAARSALRTAAARSRRARSRAGATAGCGAGSFWWVSSVFRSWRGPWAGAGSSSVEQPVSSTGTSATGRRTARRQSLNSGCRLGIDKGTTLTERGDVLDDAQRQCLRRQPDPLEDGRPLGVAEELLGDAVQPERRGDAGVVEGLEEDGATAAHPAVVLDADHQPVVAGQLDEGRV